MVKVWFEGCELVIYAHERFCFVIGPCTLSITVGCHERGFLLRPGHSCWLRGLKRVTKALNS